MQRFCQSLFLLLFLLVAFGAKAQEQTITVDDLIKSAQQWAKDNLDEETLRAIPGVDRTTIETFLGRIQARLQGDYVIDLAPIKDTARTVLPLLERYEETAPYGAWLKAQLDYLEVAEQIRTNTPPAKTAPGQPPPPPPNPAPQQVREIWIKKLANRPRPESANPYVTELKPLFAAQKVPPELVWVAEVESGFDPRARSPVGAVGLFQLMPATAARYGLHTGIFDDRLKPALSAKAAAKYLGYLHSQFSDWRLALAAYNSGEGTVQRLLTKYKTHTYDGIATHLPAETQMFVPRVEAVLLRREGLKLSQLRAPGKG